MKNQIKLFILIFVLIGAIVFIGINTSTENGETTDSGKEPYKNTEKAGEQNTGSGKKKNKRIEAGIKTEIEYFNRIYYPYTHYLPKDINDRVLNNIQTAPDEYGLSNLMPVNSWVLLGPKGSRNIAENSPGSFFTGRILDVEIDNNSGLRIASATGGLWQYGSPQSSPLSEGVSSLSIGSFTTHPTSPNIIFVGTGEPNIRGGSGLWRTVNGGANWSPVNMGSDVYAFSKIRYINNNPGIMYASGHGGFFTSGDGGSTWTRRNVTGTNPAPINDMISDFIVDPANSNIIVAAFWGATLGGIYKTTNGGANWNKITNGIPGTNVGNTTLSFSAALPSTIYANISRNDNSQTLGVYKSITSGDAWANYTNDLPEFHNGQGFHCCCIGVSPVNPNIVLVGGVTLHRSTNGGLNWTFLGSPDVHADEQIIRWNNAGSIMYVGNDGGISVSTNNGTNWTSTINNFPITQFAYIANSTSNSNSFIGGTQDNGLIRTTNQGTIWDYVAGGDGAGVAIDPFNSSIIYASNGVYGGPLPFFRLKSTNAGDNWSVINSGLSTNCGRWFPSIRTDEVGPVWIYTANCSKFYRSQDQGANWVQLNPVDFGADIVNFSVNFDGTAIYCSINIDNNPADKLKVFDGTTWSERHSGIPDNVYVLQVRAHTNNSLPNSAYAITRPGLGNPCLYKTNNKGLNWRPIGDNVINNTFATDILSDPRDTNRLYLATTTGCFRTTNAGTNWHKWNNGMPDGTIVTEFSMIDSTSINKIYIVAGTYGRSMFTREAEGDDPLTPIININTPARYSLSQNFPNPFNPSTRIKFELPKEENIILKVYSLAGEEVKTLANGKFNAGVHEITFDGADLSSGVYFYRITASGFSEVRKMMLVK